MTNPQPLDLWHILKRRNNTIAQWCESEGIKNTEDFMNFYYSLKNSPHYYISDEMVSAAKEYLGVKPLSIEPKTAENMTQQLAIMTKQELPKKRGRKSSSQDNPSTVSSPNDTNDDSKEDSLDKSLITEKNNV